MNVDRYIRELERASLDLKPAPFAWVESAWFIGALFASSLIFLLASAGCFE
jgi:hypothetical protein